MTDTFASWSARAVPVDVDGIAVAAHADGDGQVVTFLHGFPSSSLDALPLQRRLDESRLVTLDFPGFGASAKPVDRDYSIAGAADAVVAVWSHFGVSSTTLVAHDYGVTVAQELLARQHLDVEIRGIVWSNGGLYHDLHRPTAGQQLLLDPEHGAELAAAMDEQALAGGIAVTWGVRSEMPAGFVHEMWESLRCNDGNLQLHRLLHYVAERRLHADRWIAALEACPLPMRFVWGELDPVSGGHVADRLAERLPHVPLLRLADVGHWPSLEAPDELAAATRELLG